MSNTSPIVIVGSGPVGVRTVEEILRRSPTRQVVLYGDEPHEPYNRIQLSTWLAGESALGDLNQPVKRPFGSKLECRFGYRVTSIDPHAKKITDHTGSVQPYDKLILATGSEAYIPDIPGVEKQGVYTLRNLDDATALMARRSRSHHTVVLGGGLLGLETARAMQPANTQVTVIDHNDRLLAAQLDIDASDRLRKRMDELGLNILLGNGVADVEGDCRLSGVRLHSGALLKCDTLVLATGIKPRIELARQAHLSFGRGILVDDRLCTSDPHIFAVGECVEHKGEIYGLVGPGFEQAAVIAAQITGEDTRYSGSVTAARLKVLGVPVFSTGPMGHTAHFTDGKTHSYRSRSDDTYRKILVNRHQLRGALGVGRWSESIRIQTAIAANETLYPWQILRFRLTGTLWPDADGQNVHALPDSAVLCQCTKVNKGAVCRAIASGTCSIDQLATTTGAGSVCGSCKPLLGNLLGSNDTLKPAPWQRGLVAAALFSLLMTLVILVAPVISYANSVQAGFLANLDSPIHWDVLWRNRLIKQISGFSILALFAFGLGITLRKRLPIFARLGRFTTWRFTHVVLGAAVVLMLLAHTGLRMGHGLNYWLMFCFVGLLFVGAISAIVVGLEHRWQSSAASSVRKLSLWVHILLFWPVPVLLGWHIAKGYWY